MMTPEDNKPSQTFQSELEAYTWRTVKWFYRPPSGRSETRNTVEKWTGQTLLVAPRLERLEAEGLLTGTGAGKRRFQVTELAERALGRAKSEGKLFAQAQEAVAEEGASEDLIEGHESL
jgi:DNA-binding PadR family transcriptional regulator